MKIPEEMYYGLSTKMRRRAIMKAYGTTGVEIAKKEGVTPHAVYVSLKAAEAKMFRNLRMIKHIRAKYKPSQTRIERVRLFENGTKVHAIAKNEGVSKQAVSRDIKRHYQQIERFRQRIVTELETIEAVKYRPVNHLCVSQNVVNKIRKLMTEHGKSASGAHATLFRYRKRQKEEMNTRRRLRCGVTIN